MTGGRSSFFDNDMRLDVGETWVFASGDKHEVGEILEFPLDERGIPEGTYKILSRELLAQFEDLKAWRYKIECLPANPMTKEDMMDIST